MLGALTVAGGAGRDDALLVPLIAAWWVVAAGFGMWLGRGSNTSPPIAHLLADARAATSLPDQHPALVLLNRLWPLLLAGIGAGALTFVYPQVPGIAAGFALIWSLAWRHQEKAVAAIEERDGVSFLVERTSPLRPIKLVRTPGLRRDVAPAA